MPEAVVDTTVLFAAAYPRDTRYEDGLGIVHGIDDGRLPEGVVLGYVLAETLNGLNERAGSRLADEFLTRLEENERFHLRHTNAGQFADAKALFRRYENLSFVDSLIVAYMRDEGIDYLYSFDDDFDATDVRRIDGGNPFEPDG
jgi:predicted nucleic acid-binding protein